MKEMEEQSAQAPSLGPLQRFGSKLGAIVQLLHEIKAKDPEATRFQKMSGN